MDPEIESEPKNIVQDDKELLERSIRLNKRKILADIILIIVLVGITTYIVMNLEHFKEIGSDVCKLCEERTGGQCLATNLNDFYGFDNKENISEYPG